jgi:protein-S-isoprenylcysteine O-methyltransferase Ste14
MTLREKTIDSILRVATGSLALRAFLAPLAGTAFFLLLVLVVVLGVQADRLLRLPPLLPEPWNVVLGAPLLLVGLVLSLSSVLQFAMAKGTPAPLFPPPKLVAMGFYAHTRNPMLTGVLVAMYALGFLLRSICLVFVLMPALTAVMALWVKWIEEPELERRLGPEYLEYKKRVPRFFPKPWR